ncbi:condensation domain-containing protein [Nostoc sp. DedSLP03]|uniref:condensation domain-containing protein n=1 Tax=Nostoc sp. DedSLP03 TaxID=3075400 RepID=UPI002AD394D2|nr:condensation domain-containing protein [Nostoc sp. DedSLP03]
MRFNTQIIPRRDGLTSVPLSFAQERLWFLNQLEGASATYNTPAPLRLSGRLNLNALHQALAEIIRRHEILRTSFVNINGTPMQVIHPEASMNMEVVDLQHLEESEQELVVEQQIQQLAMTPFDLESPPLIRCSLLRLSNSDYVFCIDMHHIVSDGWSLGVLVRELSALYKAFCAGESSPLPNLEIQYADFALWQRQWLSGEILEEQIQYWVSQLQGAPELLQLPTDRPRPTVQTFRGTRQSIELPKTLTEDIKALSRREGTTLFMTLVAAFKSMLHYYSGQDDIVIGTDVANRNRVETEEIIGFFVNQLVLRTDLSGNPAFRELLWRVRKVALEAYDHQNMPFDKLVAALNPERHLNRTPLFQAKFVLQNTPMPDLEIEKLTVSLLEVDNGTAKFDLLLTMWETEQGLSGELEYSTDLFNAATIVRMLETFETILHTSISQPSIKLNALIRILKEAEKQKRVVKQKEFREFRRSKIENLKPQLINASKLEKKETGQ